MKTTDSMRVAEKEALDEKWKNLLKKIIDAMSLNEQEEGAKENNDSSLPSNATDECEFVGELNDNIANEFDINSILMLNSNDRIMDNLQHHDYGVVRSSPQAQSNFAGYISFKAKKKSQNVATVFLLCKVLLRLNTTLSFKK